jgi:hypothetical protein
MKTTDGTPQSVSFDGIIPKGGVPSKESRDRRRIAKARQQRTFLSFEGYYLRLQHCLAGDAVQIAPVSSQIPCKQGILQGKSRFRASRRRRLSRKPLCRRDFSANSLSKLSGKFFRRTGNSKRITGNFGGCKRQFLTSFRESIFHSSAKTGGPPPPRPALPALFCFLDDGARLGIHEHHAFA